MILKFGKVSHLTLAHWVCVVIASHCIDTSRFTCSSAKINLYKPCNEENRWIFCWVAVVVHEWNFLYIPWVWSWFKCWQKVSTSEECTERVISSRLVLAITFMFRKNTVEVIPIDCKLGFRLKIVSNSGISKRLIFHSPKCLSAG